MEKKKGGRWEREKKIVPSLSPPSSHFLSSFSPLPIFLCFVFLFFLSISFGWMERARCKYIYIYIVCCWWWGSVILTFLLSHSPCASFFFSFFLSNFLVFFFSFFSSFFLSLALALALSLSLTLSVAANTQSPSNSSFLSPCNVPTTNCLIVIPLQSHCGVAADISITTPLQLQSYCISTATTAPAPTSIKISTLTATLPVIHFPTIT